MCHSKHFGDTCGGSKALTELSEMCPIDKFTAEQAPSRAPASSWAGGALPAVSLCSDCTQGTQGRDLGATLPLERGCYGAGRIFGVFHQELVAVAVLSPWAAPWGSVQAANSAASLQQPHELLENLQWDLERRNTWQLQAPVQTLQQALPSLGESFDVSTGALAHVPSG